MHLANKRITPESWDTEGVLFDIPMAPMPGVVFIWMYPPRQKTEGGILLEGQDAAFGSKWQPDFGVVAKVGKGVSLKVGQIVQCNPMDGLRMNSAEKDWIPEGRIFALYGRVAGESWDQGVEAVVDL